MRIYLVGGAVRDRLLGLPVRDRDWVVVGGKESEMLERGYRRADSDFPVFLHPQTGRSTRWPGVRRKRDLVTKASHRSRSGCHAGAGSDKKGSDHQRDCRG